MTDKKEPNSQHKKSTERENIRITVGDNWNISKIFWGFLFIMVGSLVLAGNLGLVELHFGNIWLLWPLLIISIGLSILSVRSMIWRIISIIFAIFALAAVAWVMLGNFPVAIPVSTYKTTVDKTSSMVEQAEVNVKAGASMLRIGTTSQESVVKAELQSNISNLVKTSTITGGTQQIDLSMETITNGRWFVGDIQNRWNIDLTRNLPLILNVDSGASDIDIDMSMAMLRSMEIKTGASSLVLKLGDKEKQVDVNVESGVSSILIKIPTSVGVQLKLQNGLTSNNLADLLKIDDNTYESSGYSQSKYRVNITSKIGVSSFIIERY